MKTLWLWRLLLLLSTTTWRTLGAFAPVRRRILPSPPLSSYHHHHHHPCVRRDVVGFRLHSAAAAGDGPTEKDGTAQDALARTAAHLHKLQHQLGRSSSSTTSTTTEEDDPPPDPLGRQREHLYQGYLQQPANALKQLLQERNLPRHGRKPDLARRLAHDEVCRLYGDDDEEKEEDQPPSVLHAQDDDNNDSTTPSLLLSPLSSFAGLYLSPAAGTALAHAQFVRPSPIQAAALPALRRGESLVLHAATGSGKTLAYVLPLTERLWRHHDDDNDAKDDERFLICTPNVELAAQVAGVAAVLAPPGTVRLVDRPINLLATGNPQGSSSQQPPRLFIGSAKAIMHSLYGNGQTPAPQTPKPLAMEFLQSVRCIVLDEVDRLLLPHGKTSSRRAAHKHHHERPAAVLVAAVLRVRLGATQVVAASATVGRPLKRELARVMGLPPQEGPRVVVGQGMREEEEHTTTDHRFMPITTSTRRAVTIPRGVQHYVLQAEGQSDGKLLTAAYQVIQQWNRRHKPRRMLLVLSRGFGLNPQHVVGALKHFQCTPTPENLLDRLYNGEGTDNLVEAHRKVSGASGVGGGAPLQSPTPEEHAAQKRAAEYLLVTGEDSVRGLHLEGLDVVLVLGRPRGPDEYVHIAGRTGRAGQSGHVINIVGAGQAAALHSWETMLGLHFQEITTVDSMPAL